MPLNFLKFHEYAIENRQDKQAFGESATLKASSNSS